MVFLDTLEYPPLERFGLPEFKGQEQMEFGGITFGDTYFLRKGLEREALHFHDVSFPSLWPIFPLGHPKGKN